MRLTGRAGVLVLVVWYGVVVVVWCGDMVWCWWCWSLSLCHSLFHSFPLTQIAELSLHVGSKCLHTELSEGWNKYLLSAAKLR